MGESLHIPESGRVVICGGPRTGKSTKARVLAGDRKRMHGPSKSTDSLMGEVDWGGAADEVAKWFSEPGPWLIEGVQTARGLRRWLREHPEGKPCDRVLIMEKPKISQTKGQATLHKGVNTVLSGILPELKRRGVQVEYE